PAGRGGGRGRPATSAAPRAPGDRARGPGRRRPHVPGRDQPRLGGGARHGSGLAGRGDPGRRAGSAPGHPGGEAPPPPRGPARSGASVTRGGAGAGPGVAVVIPTHGRPDALRRCLASLARQEVAPAEVVVVDDGGTPAVDGAALPGLPGLVVVAQPHAGAGAARMTGIARTRAPLLAFLDDDCSVPPDYVAAVARVFREHPETQVA